MGRKNRGMRERGRNKGGGGGREREKGVCLLRDSSSSSMLRYAHSI